MILVCPSCDAKFKIPDGAIPAQGRTVRCAKCKNSWHAMPEQIMRKPAPKPRPGVARPAKPAQAPAAPRPAEPKPVAFDGKLDDQAAADAAALRQSVRSALMEEEPAQADTSFQDDTFDEGIGGTPPGREDLESEADDDDDFGVSVALKEKLGDKFPEEFSEEDDFPGGQAPDDDDYDDEEYDEDDFLARRRADQRRQYERNSVGRQRKLMAVGWGGLVLFWLVVLYVFTGQEENMRHYFPGTSSAVYGLFDGLDDKERFRPEDGEPLTPSPALREEYVRAMLHPAPRGLSVETRSGRQGLMLRGFVENAGTTGANVPQVRAAILDARGNELDSWIFNPAGLIIRRGGRIEFEEFRVPVPAGAAQAKVDVLQGTKSERDARDTQ